LGIAGWLWRSLASRMVLQIDPGTPKQVLNEKQNIYPFDVSHDMSSSGGNLILGASLVMIQISTT
jgi:hypothetical protein